MTSEEFKYRMVPYARKLYPLVKRILVNEDETKDALQELMIKLWNKRNELCQCQHLDAYVAATARNFCFDLKKKKRIMVREPMHEMAITGYTAETEVERREKLECFHRIMESLPEKYREVLQLREIDGFSFEEIRELTGLEKPYIRVLLSRSRMKVREELEKIYSYERGTYQPVG